MCSVKCKTTKDGKEAAVSWVDATLFFFYFSGMCS
jgi:hypothetical protein